VAAVGGGASRWLACLSTPKMVDLAYPLHLMLVRPRATHRITPDGSTVWVDRHFDEHGYARFVDALLGSGAREPAALHLVIAVAPWRYMVFQGPGGYRRALLDAGRFLTALERAAVGAGVRIAPIYDFHDARQRDLRADLRDGARRVEVRRARLPDAARRCRPSQPEPAHARDRVEVALDRRVGLLRRDDRRHP
jgi:hypothetical protein